MCVYTLILELIVIRVIRKILQFYCSVDQFPEAKFIKEMCSGPMARPFPGHSLHVWAAVVDNDLLHVAVFPSLDTAYLVNCPVFLSNT